MILCKIGNNKTLLIGSSVTNQLEEISLLLHRKQHTSFGPPQATQFSNLAMLHKIVIIGRLVTENPFNPGRIPGKVPG